MRDISFCDIFIFYKNASLFKRVLLRAIEDGGIFTLIGRGYIFWNVQVFSCM